MNEVIRSKLILLSVLLSLCTPALAAEKGTLKLEVVGITGEVKNTAEIFDASGKKVAEVVPNKSTQLDPGRYKLVLGYVGAKLTKDNVKIEPGRTSTVMFTEVAELTVKAKDLTGKDPGFGVTVTGTDPPHDKVAEFITGDSILIAPSQVDVKIDAPPQGYYWHAVQLPAGRHAVIELNQTTPAELLVQPQMQQLPLDKDTRVVIYKAGTQSQVAASDPGPEHRFRLEAGDYDVYVENHSGKGTPYITDHGIHLDWGQKVERKEDMSGEATANGK